MREPRRIDLLAKIVSALPLVFSGLALTISFFSFQLSAVRSVKPVVAITYHGDTGWYAKNVGNGPALNVVVAVKGDGDWFYPVRTSPLGVGQEVQLPWLHQTNIRSIGVSYVDIDNRRYTSLATDDLTTIRSGNQLSKWREDEIKKAWELPGGQKQN